MISTVGGQMGVIAAEQSIHEVQGFLLGPPMPGLEITELLSSFASQRDFSPGQGAETADK